MRDVNRPSRLVWHLGRVFELDSKDNKLEEGFVLVLFQTRKEPTCKGEKLQDFNPNRQELMELQNIVEQIKEYKFSSSWSHTTTFDRVLGMSLLHTRVCWKPMPRKF